MPTLPTRDDLSNRLPSQAGGIANIPVDARFEAFDRAVTGVRQVVTQAQEADDQFRLDSAESRFMVGQAKLLSDLDDGDYETYEKRYTEGLKKVREHAYEIIKSPRDRARLDNALAIREANGRIDLQGRAKAREKDFLRGEMTVQINALRDTIVTAGDPSDAIAMLSSYINSAVGQGLMSVEDGVVMRQKVASDAIMARLEMMPPEQMIATIDSMPEAALLPPDVRQALKQKAQAEMLTSANLERTMARQAQEDTYERAYESIMVSNGGLRDFRLADYPGLRPSQYDSLQKLAAQKSSGYAVVTDWNTYAELRLMAGDLKNATPEQQDAYADRLSESRHLLEERHATGLLTALAEARGKEPDSGIIDGIETENAIISGALRSMEIPTTGKASQGEPARKAALFHRMVEQRKAAKLQEPEFKGQKKLPPEVFRTLVDELTAEVVIKKSFWFDEATTAWEQEIPDETRAEIIAGLEEVGRDVNEASIRNAYLDMQKLKNGR